MFLTSGKIVACILLFASLFLFLLRGPYRAFGEPHGSSDFYGSSDFTAIYSAARCWMKGRNPYDHKQMAEEFVLSAHGPRDAVPVRKTHPSVYPPTAMPIIATVAWLPWREAILTWCLVSLVVFGLSVVLTIRSAASSVDLSKNGILLLLAGMLLYSPTQSGFAYGNPSVLVCSLVALSIYLSLERRFVISGVLLGLAHCIKPTLSICAVFLFLAWRYWMPIVTSLVLAVAAAAVSVLRAQSLDQYWNWCRTLLENLAFNLGPEGPSDPGIAAPKAYLLLNTQTIVGLFTRNATLRDMVVWVTAAALVCLYFYLRQRDSHPSYWRDVGFFSAVTLMLTYHRNYDAQLLLLLVPFLLTHFRAERVTVAVLSVCILLTAFPTQAAFSVLLGSDVTSVWRVIVFRHQPLAVLMIAICLVPWKQLSQEPSLKRECLPARTSETPWRTPRGRPLLGLKSV